jgi:hypothetical protein
MQKIYGILTDAAHVLGGVLAGYLSFIPAFRTFINDLREFLIGFTIGISIAFLRASLF